MALGRLQVPDSCPGAGPCSGRKENQLNSGLERVVKLCSGCECMPLQKFEEGFSSPRYVFLVINCVYRGF